MKDLSCIFLIVYGALSFLIGFFQTEGTKTLDQTLLTGILGVLIASYMLGTDK